MANIAYNQTIRKIVIGFGNLFNNITLIRYSADMTEQERFLVPIVFASKENYVMRLEGDPNLDKKVLMTLPVMSYEMLGFQYDPSRKLNTNVQNFSQTPSGIIRQYNPVPYNFDFNLYIYVRNIEDGNQIVEHILPFFTPDYTIVINMIPSMGDQREIPITLNSTDYDINYEGDRESDPRVIIITLNFTAQGYIFPATNATGLGGGLITHVITNFYNLNSDSDVYVFNLGSGTGTFQQYETVYQGDSPIMAIASGRVESFSPSANTLDISNIQGNFISNLPIIGLTSSASYNFLSYSTQPYKFAQIDITPNPPNANVANTIGFITTITEPTHQ